MARTSGQATVVLTGTAVIAVCYGLGRYAYGLFVPQFQASLELTPSAIGAIGGLSHVGYAAGLIVAPRLCHRLGADRVAAGAGLCAVVGLGAVAASVGPLTLGAAVLVAGTGSGLSSPALAQVVVQRFRPADRSPAQTWINSGTSLGLAVSAPTVLVGLHWRTTWGAFTLLAALVTIAAFVTLVARGRSRPSGPPDLRPAQRRAMPAAGLVLFAVVVGATSAPYWTFARQQVLAAGLSEGWSAGFWMVIGAVGLLGGAAGAMADRLGLVATLRIWSVLWAVSLGILALPALPTLLALSSAGLFGAAYMALTGLLILWAVADLADASNGVRACFLALGVGQAAATPVAGLVADAWDLPAVFALAALASLTQLVIAAAAGRAGASGAGRQRSAAPARR